MEIETTKGCLSRVWGQHIFHQNAVTAGGVVDKNVGHGTYQRAILQNGAAAHE